MVLRFGGLFQGVIPSKCFRVHHDLGLLEPCPGLGLFAQKNFPQAGETRPHVYGKVDSLMLKPWFYLGLLGLK